MCWDSIFFTNPQFNNFFTGNISSRSQIVRIRLIQWLKTHRIWSELWRIWVQSSQQPNHSFGSFNFEKQLSSNLKNVSFERPQNGVFIFESTKSFDIRFFCWQSTSNFPEKFEVWTDLGINFQEKTCWVQSWLKVLKACKRTFPFTFESSNSFGN